MAAQLTITWFGVNLEFLEFLAFYPSHELGLYDLTIIMDLRCRFVYMYREDQSGSMGSCISTSGMYNIEKPLSMPMGFF
jgi:hypothetical protein